jgi:putative membrane protein
VRIATCSERTFPAWVPTALALVGGGFAVDQFLPHLSAGWRVGLAPAVLCAGRAVNHWAQCERAMRQGEDLPLSRFPTLIA